MYEPSGYRPPKIPTAAAQVKPGYDGHLQMFVEGERNFDQNHLRFLKWLYERGSFADDTRAHPLD